MHAALVRELGWTPVGVDLSGGMLRHARGRLPVALADAVRLPVRDNSVPAVISVMVHTDMPAYPAVLREVARVLTPDGLFVHVGVHPCFCGGFAQSWTDKELRDEVGASHWPLPALLNAFGDAGLAVERFSEGGAPLPVVLAVAATTRPGTPRTPRR
ncbi:class I SAM-dependent methyltransferase [Lentzea flava]|uniref:Methyltransferase type 11 domain-containing protein n=1 Tax=Lentzea flava TaxID=103732 RepID=A0ABQ2U943_9PSEU|nr:class I SAM-dependent methyltransferase [Lentzea flava]MCP2197113.1 Methyltransferase domain-containing protein [Lentzea flava]GGU13242.1 hypothetical protein GCM10010178_00530 [Lentzea flava]